MSEQYEYLARGADPETVLAKAALAQHRATAPTATAGWRRALPQWLRTESSEQAGQAERHDRRRPIARG